MRAISLTLALLTAFTFTTWAQNQVQTKADWDPEIYKVGHKYPGYVITEKGDTLEGYLQAFSRASLDGIGRSNQTRCHFFLKESDRKPTEKYKPKDIKGYKIADKVYESIAYSGGMFNQPNFNLVVEDGGIRLYEWYSYVENYSSLKQQDGESWEAFDARRFEINLIVANDPNEPIEYGMLGMRFAKKMPELIADYPELAEKVKNKEAGYTSFKMFDVIEEYNEWVKSSKKK